MYDNELVLMTLIQIKKSLEKIKIRTAFITSADFFTKTAEGEEKLDSICMLFIAIGENLKKIDKLTGGTLLSKYPDVDWEGPKGFRDVIAHEYFNIDAEEVFGIIEHDIEPLLSGIDKMIQELP
jgi:uncharacterized protein with HEPN domain